MDFPTRINAVKVRSENKFCCECSARRPPFAAIVLVPGASSFLKVGTCVCFRCSEALKKLVGHTDVVAIKTFENWDRWTEEEVKAMEEGGNKMAMAVYESKISFDEKISASCDQGAADEFLHKKYALKTWFSQSAAKNYVSGDSALSALKGHKADLSVNQHNNSRGNHRAAELYEYDEHTVATNTSQSDAVRRRYIRRASVGGQQGSSKSSMEEDPSKDSSGFIVKTSSHSTMDDFHGSDDDCDLGESFGCDMLEDQQLFGDTTSGETTSAPLKVQDKQATHRASNSQSLRRGAARRGRSITAKDVPPAAPIRRQGGGLGASIHGSSGDGISDRARRRESIGNPGRSRSDADLSQARSRMRRRSMTTSSNGNVRSNSDPLLSENTYHHNPGGTSNATWSIDADGVTQQRRGSNERCFIDGCVDKALNSAGHSLNAAEPNQQSRQRRERRGLLASSRPRSLSNHSHATDTSGRPRSRSSRRGSLAPSSVQDHGAEAIPDTSTRPRSRSSRRGSLIASASNIAHDTQATADGAARPRSRSSRRGSIAGSTSDGTRSRESSNHSRTRPSRRGSLGMEESGHARLRSSSNHSRSIGSSGQVRQAVTRRRSLVHVSSQSLEVASNHSSRRRRSISNERNGMRKCGSIVELSTTSNHSNKPPRSRSGSHERSEIGNRPGSLRRSGSIRIKGHGKRLSGAAPGPLVRNRDKSLLVDHLRQQHLDLSSHTKATVYSDSSSGSSTDPQTEKPISLASVFQT